jgi:hypothetical protein
MYKSNDSSKDIATCCLVALLVPILVVASSLLRGWALAVLWGWFVVPFFHLPPLSIVLAIGLGLVVGMFKGSVNTNVYNKETNKTDWTKAVTLLAEIFLSPLAAVGIGYIVKMFM